ncbi:hypothetical protein P879_01616 [Paragonimus westermani]|uniref:RRM domain-containing protein n=1 Tax=Paragonimus westermani TaxID=34504 RepID=A0A8T0DS67_9TREM|nr:hypothetical protein P879_01616 [Paragonimus westermani]
MHELTKCGQVVDVWIVRNPPGFAFVEYVKVTNPKEDARMLDGVNFCEAHVIVQFACGGRIQKSSVTSFHGTRSAGRDTSRRSVSPRRNCRYSPPFGSSRYPYDQLAPFYHPEVANEAAAAAPAAAVVGFPYKILGYLPMLPFLSAKDIYHSLQ